MKNPLIILFICLVIKANLVFAETANYFLQPGDVLSVSVWKEVDLQQSVLVRPDGGVSFPLVGDIQASGKTVEDVRKIITRKLAKLIPDVQVSVALQELNGNLIYVVGKVNRPGVFPFSRNVDVLQALGMAGGATAFAALNDIKVLRRTSGQLKSIQFRYGDLEKGKNLQQNIILQSGDTVLVP
jgi:polysaccharide export outer membrane protein